MKKVLILDRDYPAEDNLYGDVFVHTRVKAYRDSVKVQVVSFFRDIADYEYEGVEVKHAPKLEDVFRIHQEFKPDCVFIHFYDRRLFAYIKEIKEPVFIWVHGYEALGWYRKLFNYTGYYLVRNFHNIAIPNLKQMIGFRKLIRFSNSNSRIQFVFVSEWMRQVAQRDSFLKIRRYSIIPNPINTGLFKYILKDGGQRKKILMIRSFNSKKYANDIAVKAILLLSKRDFFKDINISIYGKGKFFKTLTEPLRSFKNIYLHEGFVPNTEIPAIHQKFGIFLCPTRQDAQGVSMCEAMSSGLVPITSKNTAIPEFVDDGETGILTTSVAAIAEAVESLYQNESLFLKLSKGAALSMQEQCSIEDVCRSELSLIGSI